MTVEAELLKTLKIKRKPSEGSDQAFLTRLVQEAQDLETSLWEGMSPKAQKWVNEATKAYNASKELPGFPDAGEETAEDEDAVEVEEEATEDDDAEDADDTVEAATETDPDDEEEVEDEMETQTTTITKKGKSAKAAPGKLKTKEKLKVKKVTAKPRGNGARPMHLDLKELVLNAVRNGEELPLAELFEKLQKKGHDPSRFTVSTMRSQMLETMRFLKGQGLLKLDV